MTLRDLTPWRGRREATPAPHADSFQSFHREIDRLFDDFSRGFSMPFLWNDFSRERALSPQLDVRETEKAYEVSVELPGIDEKDLEVSLANGVLTIKGEKREEKEQKESGRLHVERSFGSFHRSLALPENADEEKIDGAFKNGVLELTIGKSGEAKVEARKIDIKTK
ncbi:MAG: Hsp20/alpha crystallin family protein [Alphaproteobacteria bacterium]|nr:Hsp20/alpha crystallin family protein [Alphaproteobacteria bacterium]